MIIEQNNNIKNVIRQNLKERYLIAQGNSNTEIKRIQRKNNISGSLFIFTPIFVISLYVFGAFAIALVMSMFSGELDPTFSKVKFVGFTSWTKALNEPLLLRAIKNTLLFAAVTTGINIMGAIIITSILNLGKIRNKRLFLTIYFFPQVTSSIAASIIFIKILGQGGVFGLDFVRNPEDAMWIMIISSVWSGISGGMITFNTAFSGIGNSQYEAALIDGSKTWTTFWKITIPALGPILAYSLVTSIIGAMGVFDQAYVMTLIGSSPNSVMTWSLLGFARIMDVKNAGLVLNVGVGVVTLILLGITIFVLTRIVTIFKPIDRK